MIAEDPTKFKDLVQESLRRQVAAINSLSDVGKYCTQSQIGWDIYNSRKILFVVMSFILIIKNLIQFRLTFLGLWKCIFTGS